MAEGVDEAESNSGGESAAATAMLGTAMPCETMSPSLGNLKREFDAYHSAIMPSAPSTPIPQGQPINLKSEEFEKERESPACSPLPTNFNDSCRGGNLSMSLMSNSTMMGVAAAAAAAAACAASATEQMSPPPSSHSLEHSKSAVAVAAAAAAQAAHLNGTMQGMLNLQKLQNLASIQQQSSMPTLASLQGLAAGLPSTASLNSPLNLSVGSTSNLQSPFQVAGSGNGSGGGGSTSSSTSSSGSGTLGGTITAATGSASGGGNSASSGGVGNGVGAQWPQLILASGQLMHGIQGAQLLIPTSQGITTQTILTIPVSQQINSNEQLVQTLAALNNGAASLNSIQLQSLQQQQQQQQQTGSGLLSPNVFPNSIQQLLTAVQSQQTAFNQQHHQQQTGSPQPGAKHMLAQHLHHHHHHQHSQHHHQQQQQDQNQQQQQHQQQPSRNVSPYLQQTNHHSVPIRNPSPISRTRVHTPKHSPPRSASISSHLSQYDKPSISTSPPSSASQSSTQQQQQQQHQHTPQHPSSYSSTNGQHSLPPTSSSSSSSHHLCNRAPSPNTAAMTSISRLTSTNGELTITKSHGPSVGHNSSISNTNHNNMSNQHSSSLKMSPTSSIRLSPVGTDNSNTDLLSDSPDEPTINQTNCNVVDGIDLDEIKEFAKAFKLRRLSLGLTQTQVGQALSVTEGPAYSQSAICSALAAQMYAAQLSSQQQQNMFEKLDITPKSAQKIKPVLERWMKEAEESHWNRYKSGQNHLTDFIGVEPSKKRKRRTSFTPQALELLNAHFERNTHPSGTEITGLAHQLGYEREVIRIWFCNKRQALKNTVRMMSKGMV